MNKIIGDERKTVEALFGFSVTVECPYCMEFTIDLEDFLVDDDRDELLDHIFGNSDGKKADWDGYEAEIECADCGEIFKVNGIVY